MNSNLNNYFEYYKFLSDLDNVSLNFGPVSDANEHPLEQIYIANIFKNLVKSPKFCLYHFYIISANSTHDFTFDQSSIVFYLSNENHNIPDNIRAAKAIFSPYCPLKDDLRPDNCYPIPLGYNGSQVDLSFIEIQDRYHEVFFSGNIHRRRISFFLNSLIYLLIRKVRSIFSSSKLIDLFMFNRKFTGGLSAENYSKILMNTKIALVPEGYISNISFRFFEAARFGCVIITPKLYDYWFFKEFTGIQIDHWGQLNGKIKSLSKNPLLLKDIQNRTIDFYANNCSEQAVSNYILTLL